MENTNEKRSLPPDMGADQMYQPLNNSAQVYPGTQQQCPQQPMPQTSGYQQPQTIYIQSMPSAPRSYQHYKGKLSVIFGVTNIVLVTISIILNGIGFHLQHGREYDWFGNIAIILCPAAFCGFFVYLAASFAIAAGKFKTRCLIITHLVLAIVGSCFAFTFMAFSFGALAYEVPENRSEPSAASKGSYAIVILWVLMSVAIFIMNTWGAALCCRVLCCREADDSVGVVAMVTTGTGGGNAPPGAVVMQQAPSQPMAPGVMSPPPAYDE